MKTRKLISVLLAVVMLFSVMSIAVSAEGETTGYVYSAVAKHDLSRNGTVSETLFSYDLTIDESKIACFDGGSTKYSKEITSIVASYQVTTFDSSGGETITADYMTDPEAFFAVFQRQEDDRAAIEEYNNNLVEGQPEHAEVEPASITVGFDIIFEDPSAFGSLDYTVSLSVIEPTEMDIPLVGGLLDSARLPTTAEVTGSIWNFPVIDKATLSIDAIPTKTSYYDNEIFELEGTQISFTVKRALTDDKYTAYETVSSGSVTYRTDNTNNDANAYMFTCHPERGTKLPVNTTSVVTYFNGYEIGKTPVSVSHKWSDGPVNITTDKWTETKPGYHATVCEGCGETHNAMNHVVADEDAWTPNNDQTFVGNGTESNTCADCGAVLTRDALGSADYNDAFANYHFLRVILDYVNLILRIIGAAGIN